MREKKTTKKHAPVKTVAPAKETKKIVKKPEHKLYVYSVGRRKSAVARVRIVKKGTGIIIVNGKEYTKYFQYFEYQQMVYYPLKATGFENNIDISVKVQGGGTRSQAEAVRHGISRGLILQDETLRKVLKPLGFLRRDPREKERKKPGLKRARRAPQWQKR